jgi:HSP20 family protein
MEELTMAMRDLIPWNKSPEVSLRSENNLHPFLALHQEMNRMFEDVFRSFDLAPRGWRASDSVPWPSIDIDDMEKEIRITVELPGLDEKDIEIQIADGVLSISGEKRSEREDRDRRFSERVYGRFERRIPVRDVEEGSVSASFKNGLLSVILPKSEKARQSARRIAINGQT